MRASGQRSIHRGCYRLNIDSSMSIGLLDTEADTSGKFNLTLRKFRR